MKKPELLAPAGNMEKLRIAIHYGADAVYLGGKKFGLRNLADNFSLAELADAVTYAHDRNVRAYLTVNSFPDNNELADLRGYLEEIAHIPFDAYIGADPGVISLITEISPERDIHLSTQANTVNWQSALFWQRQGIKRINLAREMSLEAIRETRERVTIGLEAFTHGAMCISYSGRCLISSVLTGRNANKGECSHPCRWSYSLVEETRPGEYFPVMEDETGTFIFNSKDLCLIQCIPELIGSGVDSLKIEGRMKGIHYVASVIRVYREAIDRYCDDPRAYRFDPAWLEELSKISHRGYTTGFFFGAPRDVDHEYHSAYLRSHDFVGIVEEVLSDGSVIVGVRNRITTGETIELIGTGMSSTRFELPEMQLIQAGREGSQELEKLESANPNSRVRMKIPFAAQQSDLLRREKIRKH